MRPTSPIRDDPAKRCANMDRGPGRAGKQDWRLDRAIEEAGQLTSLFALGRRDGLHVAMVALLFAGQRRMVPMTVSHMRRHALLGPVSSGRVNRTGAETLRQTEKDGDKDCNEHVHDL